MRIRRTIQSLCMASFVLLNSIGDAQAASAVANMQANATLNPTCSMSATDVHFTGYVPAGTPGTYNWLSTATQPLSVNLVCTNGTSVTLSLVGGGPTGIRNMAGTGGNTDTLVYRVKWGVRSLGDGSGTTATMPIASPASGTYNFSVVLPLNQYITPDSYSDTVTVTATY